MKELVYAFIRLIAAVHDHLLTINDAYEARFSDKDLHFLVFGVAGTIVFLGIWALFKWMRRHIGVVAWLFSFVVMLMIALAVEVGQGLTQTGTMEIEDIAAGMIGFIAFSLIAGIVFGSIGMIQKYLRRSRKNRRVR